MSTRFFANFERASSASSLCGLSKPKASFEDTSLEFPRYLSDAGSEKHDGLGCLRGVATALGIQAIVLILAFAIWKLH